MPQKKPDPTEPERFDRMLRNLFDPPMSNYDQRLGGYYFGIDIPDTPSIDREDDAYREGDIMREGNMSREIGNREDDDGFDDLYGEALRRY